MDTTPSAAPIATPAVREQVVATLQVRFAEDHLSIAEFERRVAAAYQARTLAELDALITDLAPAVAVTDAATVPSHGRIVTVLSNNERGGAMSVPRHLEIVSVLGNIALDLRDAIFGDSMTEIDISAVFGNVELTLPVGMRIESHGNAFLGSFDDHSAHASGYPADSTRTIRITGQAVFGSVEIGAAESANSSLMSRGRETLGGTPRRLT